ncbi:cyclic nucleotide-binding domain-containing protein [Sinorhizobium meliloti]|nr:cyclic nucleotide-binding domain-containing protein [Sinorhizobium meliloti]MDE4578324.1 cyclic nucleotide-binding domain-containing protein [Sinorhizobium meliloti]
MAICPHIKRGIIHVRRCTSQTTVLRGRTPWTFPNFWAHLVATYKPGREIYAQGDLNGKCYQVSTGAVRVYRLLSDGRRQVVSFHLPGEMFGCEADPTTLSLPKPSTKRTPAVFGRRRKSHGSSASDWGLRQGDTRKSTTSKVHSP